MPSNITYPKPSGPLTIGVMDLELTDESRAEVFAPATNRRIPVRAWYPAVAGNGEPRPNAKPAELEHLLVPFLAKMSSDPNFTMALNAPTHAYEDATPLADARRPVLIFSHGAFGCPQGSTTLMEHFASHGYVVLSISHPYVDSATLHENGDIIRFNPALLEDITAKASRPEILAGAMSSDPGDRLEATLANNRDFLLAAQYLVWEEDFLHVVDRLHKADLPAKARTLLDIVDLDRLGTFGMSFGGSAAAAAQRDTRIKATINIDGGTFDVDMIDRESRIPMLILHSDMSFMPTSHPHSEFFYEKLATMGTSPDIIRVEIKGSTHIGLTDLCLIPPERRTDPMIAASLGSIDGQRAIVIMNDFCKAFFDHYLSHAGSGLDGAFRANYPEVVDIDLSHMRAWAIANPRPDYTHAACARP